MCMPWVVGGLRAPGGTTMEASEPLTRARALSSLSSLLVDPPLPPPPPPPPHTPLPSPPAFSKCITLTDVTDPTKLTQIVGRATEYGR